MKNTKERDAYILEKILDYLDQCQRVIAPFKNAGALGENDDAFMIVKGDLEAIGEGVRRLSPEATSFLKSHGIPVEAIRGFRNHLAHGYFGFDASFVYPTCVSDLPPL